MAIRQKSSVKPAASSTSRTRSCSPTLAPPVVTSRSWCRAASTRVAMAARSSGATGRMEGSPPAARTMAARAKLLEE